MERIPKSHIKYRMGNIEAMQNFGNKKIINMKSGDILLFHASYNT